MNGTRQGPLRRLPPVRSPFRRRPPCLFPPDAPLTARFRPDLLGGIVTVTAGGLCRTPAPWPETTLYRPSTGPASYTAAPLTFVLYYAWNNRDPGEMTVWIPEAV